MYIMTIDCDNNKLYTYFKYTFFPDELIIMAVDCETSTSITMYINFLGLGTEAVIATT